MSSLIKQYQNLTNMEKTPSQLVKEINEVIVSNKFFIIPANLSQAFGGNLVLTETGATRYISDNAVGNNTHKIPFDLNLPIIKNPGELGIDASYKIKEMWIYSHIANNLVGGGTAYLYRNGTNYYTYDSDIASESNFYPTGVNGNQLTRWEDIDVEINSVGLHRLIFQVTTYNQNNANDLKIAAVFMILEGIVRSL